MKFVFACILFLAVSAWSNPSILSTQLRFENGYLNIDTTKSCNVDTTYINCSLEKGLAYYSSLDTGYAVFFEPSIAKIQIFKYPPAQENLFATNKLDQVLRYEFLKWVEWGIVKMPKDSALHLMDWMLGSDGVDIGGLSIVYKRVCDVDPSQCRGERAWGGSEGIPEEYVNRLPQKKVLLSAESENPGTTSLPHKSSKGIRDVGIVPQGTGYKAFDVNGVYLYRGMWQGVIESLNGAVILKFDNGKIAVVR